MTTASITHRPIPMATAAAASVAVLAFVGLTVAQNDAGTSPSAPSSPAQSLVHHKWHPTTAGGQTQLGLP